MALDMTGFVEVAKDVLTKLADKIGRKQIIALATIGVLGWLINNFPEVDFYKLCIVAGVGTVGIVAQLLLDLKRPRAQKE